MSADYTPTTDEVRQFATRWADCSPAEFDRWLESVEAAAEQRGAEKERAQIVARMGAAAGIEAGR